ncbi:hypothetical protein Tco_0618319 [Tanacetum coccineum]
MAMHQSATSAHDRTLCSRIAEYWQPKCCYDSSEGAMGQTPQRKWVVCWECRKKGECTRKPPDGMSSRCVMKELVQVPYGNEMFVRFAERNVATGSESRFDGYLMFQKLKSTWQGGCQVFLAQIFRQERGGTSRKGNDRGLYQFFRDVFRVFPEDFPVSTSRPMEFQIDLVPGAAPVARAPYRLAPSEMKELSEQLQELSDKVS